MRHLLTLSYSFLLLACQATKPNADLNTGKVPNRDTQAAMVDTASGLKDSHFQFKEAFKGHFLVGTALSQQQILNDKKIQTLVSEQFNALTAENAMKWERINPLPGTYDWQTADALVEYSEKHNMFVTGHTLIWHQQVPDWVFKDKRAQQASAALLLQRMKRHIKTVVGRYKGRVQSWDVLNEAFNDDGSYRESLWFNILGPTYIETAFELAHKADPQAKLYYNDYNVWKPEKRDRVVRMVKHLKQKGIPIHGIGMQGHYGLHYPENLQDIEDAIVAFHQLGVDVMVTELDVTVIPFPDSQNQGADISLNIEWQQKYNPYPDGLSEAAQQAFDRRYADFFNIFIKHSDKLQRVTFWGVHDAQSWRNGWPIEGRTDYPLLIDRDLQVKPVAKSLLSSNP